MTNEALVFGDISITIELITPKIAQDYLENNTHNRSVTSANIRRITNAITEDRWYITNQGIGFDKNGVLLDGQHRLESIRISGKPVHMIVVRGIDPHAFTEVDNGARRGAAAVLSVEKVKDNNNVAAAYQLLSAYHLARTSPTPISLLTAFSTARMENNEVLSWYERHPGLAEWSNAGRKLVKASDALQSASACTAALYLGSRINLARTHDFVDGVVSGAGLEVGDPRLTLRNRNELRQGSHNRPALLTFPIIGKALRSYLDGRSLKELKSSLLDTWPDLGDLDKRITPKVVKRNTSPVAPLLHIPDHPRRAG